MWACYICLRSGCDSHVNACNVLRARETFGDQAGHTAQLSDSEQPAVSPNKVAESEFLGNPLRTWGFQPSNLILLSTDMLVKS